MLNFFFFFSLIGRWPNTYTFTKALAEQVVKDKTDKVPAAVFRPAIGTYNLQCFSKKKLNQKSFSC